MTAQDIRHSILTVTAIAAHKAGVVRVFPEADTKIFTMSEYVKSTKVDVVEDCGKKMQVSQQVLS